MKLLADRSPRALAALTLLGGCVAGSGFFIIFPGRSHLWLGLVSFLVRFGGGLTLYIKSQAELKNGVQNDRWPQEQVEPLRAIVDSPFYMFAIWALFWMYCIVFLVDRHSRWHAVGWGAFLVTQAASQLKNALRPPAPPRGQPSTLSALAPLHSDHWGER